MNISIRDYIRDNFKKSTGDEIKEAIEESVTSSEEEALPGMGVFFEIIWKNSDDDERKNILNKLLKDFKEEKH